MIRTLACLLTILAVNLAVAGKLFTIEYLPYRGSIEGAYHGIARYILENFGDFGWYPLWYCGIPFENVYPPVTHFFTAGVAWIGGISTSWAHHIVGASAYCAAPLALYWMAWRFSGDRLTALGAGLAFSLLPFSSWLLPSIGVDAGDLFGSRRLHAMVHYGEAPHATGIALIPVALAALDRALARTNGASVLTVVLTLAAVVLSNWLAAFALAVGAFAYLAAKLDPRKTLQAAGIGALAYLVASPWVPPSNIAAISRNAQLVAGDYQLGVEQALYGAVLLAAMLAVVWLTRNADFYLRFTVLFTLPMFVVPMLSEWAGIYVIPQPLRYHIQMEMGLSLLVGSYVSALNRRLGVGGALAPAVPALMILGPSMTFSDQVIREYDREAGVEYAVARWLDENLPGQRVFVPGATRFWVNTFGNNPQLGGSFDQGIVNPTIPAVTFRVPYTEGDGEATVTWLKAYGVRAIVVQEEGTREVYVDYRDTEKFVGVLEEVWRDGGDVIYSVPARSDSLAYALWADDLVAEELSDEDKAARVAEYVAALEDMSLPAVGMSWNDPDRIKLTGQLEREHRVSLQVTYHRGWSAQSNGREVSIERDGLGFIVLSPQCDGPCAIELSYDGGLEIKLAKAASYTSLAGLVGWALLGRRRIETRDLAAG